MEKYITISILIVAILFIFFSYINKTKPNKIGHKRFNDSPLSNIKYSNFKSGKSFESPIENEVDAKIVALTDLYKEVSDLKRKEIRNSISEGDMHTLLDFCNRATVFGIRNKNKNILSALIAISMIDINRFDYRDIIVTLAIINHGMERMNLKTDGLYDEAVNISSHETSELIKSFQNRNSKEKRIEIMGYTEYKFDEGIGFLSHWTKDYNPKNDLAKISFEISSYLTTDKYKEGEVSVGTEIPFYWFGPENKKKRDKLINSTTGTSMLQSRLKEEISNNSESLYLNLYLVEFENEKKSIMHAKELMELKDLDRVVIVNNVNKIVYILSSKSGKHGLSAFEDESGIKRFQEKIEEIINKMLNSH